MFVRTDIYLSRIVYRLCEKEHDKHPCEEQNGNL